MSVIEARVKIRFPGCLVESGRSLEVYSPDLSEHPVHHVLSVKAHHGLPPVPACAGHVFTGGAATHGWVDANAQVLAVGKRATCNISFCIDPGREHDQRLDVCILCLKPSSGVFQYTVYVYGEMKSGDIKVEDLQKIVLTI